MADDFSQPLGQRASRTRRRTLFDPLWASAILLLSMPVLAGGWVAVVDDPWGGEPTALARIEPAVASVRAGRSPVSPAESRAEQPPLPDLETIARNVRILDASGAPVGGATVRSMLGDGALSLARAPDPRLVEPSPVGPLPRIGEDGSRPADVYARPVVRVAGGAKARVAIVVTGLGTSDHLAQEAIRKLPGAVTLAFVPYGERLADAVADAREDGHEVVLELPMEPSDTPMSDPGPKALLTSLPAAANAERLRWAMGRFPGYAGVTSHMGGRFLSAEPALLPVLQEVRARGLYYLDRGVPQSLSWRVATSLGLQSARSDLVIDGVPEAEAIDSRLLELESLARTQGAAIAFASALPVTIERIAHWAEGLAQRGVLLVPASAAMPRPTS